MHEKGKFPAQPEPNPKSQQHPQMGNSGNQNMSQVKSVITICDSKVVEKHIVNPRETSKDLISENREESVKPLTHEEITNSLPVPPFPQALIKPKKSNHSPEIYEVFKQVKVNIPLLDTIKQIPSYAKFLKNLCTVKREHKVQKKAFLVKQVSSILSTNSALKYKDPGCPTISCIIGDHKIRHALLALGASVNLLPYSMYQQLNLNKLKPTSITLLFADRSIKVPRGIIEDVLV
ncbi:uncharacterized protein LOC112099574 [Citrus clementina]|uniref:uncharacterized protein LOC112099574 n=1 Tax=Citrus clementina TaxID=85681 RepID=UPI000CED1DC8|nr:uncharacterized protein LOC112099574 [Citrus x clementina]